MINNSYVYKTEILVRKKKSFGFPSSVKMFVFFFSCAVIYILLFWDGENFIILTGFLTSCDFYKEPLKGNKQYNMHECSVV